MVQSGAMMTFVPVEEDGKKEDGKRGGGVVGFRDSQRPMPLSSASTRAMPWDGLGLLWPDPALVSL
jgi:hypothetical protein